MTETRSCWSTGIQRRPLLVGCMWVSGCLSYCRVPAQDPNSPGRLQVFPGGNLDQNQDQSLAITAIRETFEESGLLLASPPPAGHSPSDEALDEARHAIHEQRLQFQTFLESHHLQADADSLLPFTQWITPVGPPRYVFPIGNICIQ